MKVNCLSCGFQLGLDDAYDNYEGLIKCFACSAMLEIKAEEGDLKEVHFGSMVSRPSTEEVFGRAG
jgi:hypothetical protein